MFLLVVKLESYKLHAKVSPGCYLSLNFVLIASNIWFNKL